MLPKFITLHDYGAGTPLRINCLLIFSLTRHNGTQLTQVKSVTGFEQVRETPEEIEQMIREPSGI